MVLRGNMTHGIYDWNLASLNSDKGEISNLIHKPQADFQIFDETLRDGIQSPVVKIPSLQEKFALIEHMAATGIGSADLGFPGASAKAEQDCKAIARYIVDSNHPVDIAFAGRTHVSDVRAICNVAHAVGESIDAYLFVGVSPIRQYVEGWDVYSVTQKIIESALLCRAEGIEFVLVLEDSLRCSPDILAALYAVAVDCNVSRVVLCDTVGCALPTGTYNIINWTKNYFAQKNHPVLVDWHGHNDRGMALINSVVAISQGCHRVHGTILGVGERAGNTAIDQLIINCYLLGWGRFDLKDVYSYCKIASRSLSVTIPDNYPAMGSGVFKTSAGVHASAILKTEKMNDLRIKDLIYSSVPANELGRKQEILIDSSSGINNVLYWLKERNISVSDSVIERILDEAKLLMVPIKDEQIMTIINASMEVA